MWMLNFLPTGWITALVNLALVGSVLAIAASWLLTKVPVISKYAQVMRIAGVAVLLGATYFKGGLNNELQWRERVAELEAKVQAAEEKSRHSNEKVRTRVVERTRVVREKAQTQIQYIDRVVKGDTVEIVRDMTEEQRQEFLARQQELQAALKNCPVPKIIVEEQNKAAGTK